MESLCPVCETKMSADDSILFCENCQCRYQPLALCPDCGKPLDILKACGAVDYFCPNGDGLISKHRVAWRYSAL